MIGKSLLLWSTVLEQQKTFLFRHVTHILRPLLLSFTAAHGINTNALYNLRELEAWSSALCKNITRYFGSGTFGRLIFGQMYVGQMIPRRSSKCASDECVGQISVGRMSLSRYFHALVLSCLAVFE